MLRLVFDLDECLVATREANRLAYLEVGFVVPDTPELRHRPASDWPEQPTAEQRAAKHEIFERHLRREGRLLPVARLLRLGASVVLTGTSTRSVQTICRVHPQLSDLVFHTSMTPEQKLIWLRGQTKTGIYFDDWAEMVRRVREETSWQSIDVTGF